MTLRRFLRPLLPAALAAVTAAAWVTGALAGSAACYADLEACKSACRQTDTGAHAQCLRACEREMTRCKLAARECSGADTCRQPPVQPSDIQQGDCPDGFLQAPPPPWSKRRASPGLVCVAAVPGTRMPDAWRCPSSHKRPRSTANPDQFVCAP